MQTIINYIIESSVSLAVLTGFYLVVLRASSLLQFKRMFLLASLVFSAVLPLFHVSLTGNVSQTNTIYNVLQTVTVVAGDFTTQTLPVVQNHNWLRYVYLVGMLLFALRMLMGFIQIGLMGRLFQSQKIGFYRLFVTESRFRPFSFFRWIFIPQTLWNSENRNAILVHEKEHVRQWHSVDIFLLELVLMLQWFNPLAWVIRKEIKNNNEFMADRAVLDAGISRADYLKSMLFGAVGARFEMGNNFSLSITQKRIKMMKSNKLKQNVYGKSILTLLLFGGLFLAFACESNTTNMSEPVQDEELLLLDDEPKVLELDDEQEFRVVEQMPQFPGGDEALLRFLQENVEYPPQAQEQGIMGRVYVSFVVDKSGEIRDVDIARSVDPNLDKEALRVVKLMPPWTPGKQRGKDVNVKYMLPVNFVLQ